MLRVNIVLFMMFISCGLFAQSADSTFKPSGKVIVDVFGTAFYNVNNHTYDYNFGRAHLGYQYKFAPNWSAKIIIDRGRPTSAGNLMVRDSQGNQLHVENSSKEGAYYTMFLKFASVHWQVNDKLALEGGAILQNHYITQERFWGLRYVAQTFQDMYWKIPSSDLGFIAYYNISPVFSFDVAITNGEGPRKQQDTSGDVKFAGGLNINLSNKFQTRLYYHNKHSSVDALETEQMFSAFTGFKPTNKLRVGAEFNYMDNLNNITDVDSYGLSVYSAYYITDKTQVFARYDRLEYDTHNNKVSNTKGDGDTMIGGVSYTPIKGVNLSLNYQRWISDNTITDSKSNILMSMEYKF